MTMSRTVSAFKKRKEVKNPYFTLGKIVNFVTHLIVTIYIDMSLFAAEHRCSKDTQSRLAKCPSSITATITLHIIQAYTVFRLTVSSSICKVSLSTYIIFPVCSQETYYNNHFLKHMLRMRTVGLFKRK